MPPNTPVDAVAHVINLSVAPVFLLSGIGAMLSVMTHRLGRVIDRARSLETRLEEHPGEAPVIHRQLETLLRRAKLVGRAITLCTTTALLVCGVIAILFLGASMGFNASAFVAFLFIVAMLAFFVGLLLFVREILLSTASLRIGPPRSR